MTSIAGKYVGSCGDRQCRASILLVEHDAIVRDLTLEVL